VRADPFGGGRKERRGFCTGGRERRCGDEGEKSVERRKNEEGKGRMKTNRVIPTFRNKESILQRAEMIAGMLGRGTPSKASMSV